MKRITISIAFLLTLSCFAEYDNIGFSPSNNLRDNPFRPSSVAPIQRAPEAQDGATLHIKDVIPNLLTPTGVKTVDFNTRSILIGDAFYGVGDVLHVEIIKNPEQYDTPADDVKIVKVTAGEFYVQLRSEQGANKKEVVIQLPRPDKLETRHSSVVSDIGRVSFLRHEEALNAEK